MPEKIKLEDGSEREVLTDEEVKELQDKAKKSEEFTSKLDELEKENESLKQDPTVSGFVELRKANTALKKALKESGKEIDDDGNVKEENITMTPEDFEKLAEKKANEALLKQHINNSLKNVDEDKRELITKNYEKVIAGEEVDLSNVDTFLGQATKISGVEVASNPLMGAIVGSQTREVGSDGGEKKFSDTEAGTSLASSLNLDIKDEENK